MVGRIGKTRQQTATRKRATEIEEVFDAAVGKARGVLNRVPPAGRLKHVRRSPSPELAGWIDHYWLVSWDLRGHEPFVAETLPHPNFQVIFEKDRSVVSGVFTGKFSRRLQGRSHVFGIKFNPGSFRPFLKTPASSLMNRSVPVKRIFGLGAEGKIVDELESVLVGRVDEDRMIDAADAFFRARVPAPDETATFAGSLVRRILKEPEIKTVDDLVDRLGISKRTLQRLFNEYVGATPKWVIRRYRLHELVEKLNSGDKVDWADLALELGYFDQAHLINDFKSIVGYSPTRHQKVRAPDRR